MPSNNKPKIAQPGKQTIAAVIAHACALKGNDIFLNDERHGLSGAELWQSILALAANLRSLGLNKGDTAVFYCQSSVSHAAAMFACLISGIIVCCLHTRETRDRNKANVDFLQAKAIFADPDFIGETQMIVSRDSPQIIIDLSSPAAKTDTGPFEFPSLSVNDSALILLSSGTTGQPKFILHSPGTLAATAKFGPYIYDCWSPSDSTRSEPSSCLNTRSRCRLESLS